MGAASTMLMKRMNKSYRELILLKTFDERFEYLKLNGVVGGMTFGSHRWLNQVLYTSPEWREFRHKVIIRDNGCDLAMEGYEIEGDRIIIHHLNPLTIEDVQNRDRKIFDLDNVISTSDRTHKAIHYGDKSLLPAVPIFRTPGDTLCWN